MLSTGIEQESRKRTGGWLLALILVGVIGYAGYRVYPPILDLWRLAHASAETLALMSKADTSAPQTTNPENSNAVPAAQQPSDAPPPAVVASTTAAAAEASTPQPAEQAPPVAAAKPAEPAVAPASSADPSPTVPPKPAVTAPASPARLLESKLRKELAGQPIAEKLKIQATPTALTLSGTISLAEHRELLGHLRTVPADVRIIDDTEYAEDQNQKGTTASASSGWIWIRSVPPGAQIFVDGVDTHLHTPVSIELQAGQHEVRLMREGFGAAQRNVVVNRGQTMQFTQTLAAE
jgi:hypothetical protein